MRASTLPIWVLPSVVFRALARGAVSAVRSLGFPAEDGIHRVLSWCAPWQADFGLESVSAAASIYCQIFVSSSSEGNSYIWGRWLVKKSGRKLLLRAIVRR